MILISYLKFFWREENKLQLALKLFLSQTNRGATLYSFLVILVFSEYGYNVWDFLLTFEIWVWFALVFGFYRELAFYKKNKENENRINR
jgi:hypothetical protein